jgi:hypothetical protein
MRKNQVGRLLKKHSYLFLIISMGLFLSGPYSLAQTPSDNSQSAPENQIQEEHDTKNLNKLLKDYNKNQEKVLKDSETINEMESSSELSDKDLNSAKSNGTASTSLGDYFKKRIEPKDLKKVKYSNAVKLALEPLQKLKERELLTLLHENTKGSAAGTYIDRFPTFALFAVRLIKDPSALPSLASIADDSEKVINFIGVMLCTFLVAFILKRYTKKEGRPVMEAIGIWFLRFLIITSLRFGILMYFYSTELSPAFSIVSKTFF